MLRKIKQMVLPVNERLIAQPEYIVEHISDSDILIIDVGTPEQYAEAHILNAINLPYTEFVTKKGNIEGAMVADEKIIELFSEAGIDRTRPIYIYDATNNARACRLIWTLHVFNHFNASIIDGAKDYWIKQGYPTSTTPHKQSRREYTIERGKRKVTADKDVVAKSLLDPSKTTLLDTRSIEEFQGKKIVGCAKKAGHIPGAQHLFWKELFDEDNFFRIKTREEIAAILKQHHISDEKQIIVYCQSHLRSSHTYVVLKAMGFGKVLGYAGSWSQWSADLDSPVNISTKPSVRDQGEGSDLANKLLPILTKPENLKEILGHKKMLLIDISDDTVYDAGHIPGAIRFHFASIHYQHDFCDCDIPSNEDLSTAFSIMGLEPDIHVVAYDRQFSAMAMRLGWTLEMIGHTNFSVLDGGLAAWQAAGYETVSEPSFFESSNYIANRKDHGLITKSELIDAIDDPLSVIIDVRMEEERDNELVMCGRGGYIPGSLNFDWEEAVDFKNNASMKPLDVIQDRVDKIGIPNRVHNIIVHCQTHNRSSHSYYVFKLLGYKNVKAYAAGYSEWGNDLDVPIENEYFGED
jgi:thiosulfate/3-mercaptopyruvate sulfurtransferase